MSDTRRERDTGQPAATVLYTSYPGNDTYHEDRDCQYLRNSTYPIKRTTRSKAQTTLDRHPCRRCVLNESYQGTDATPPEERFADLIAHDRVHRPAAPSE